MHRGTGRPAGRAQGDRPRTAAAEGAGGGRRDHRALSDRQAPGKGVSPGEGQRALPCFGQTAVADNTVKLHVIGHQRQGTGSPAQVGRGAKSQVPEATHRGVPQDYVAAEVNRI